MLSPYHVGHPYPPPVFSAKATDIPSCLPGAMVIAVERAAATPTFIGEASPSWNESDLDEVTLEEFNTRYLTIRDDLGLRSLRGEILSARERSTLDQLNEALDRLLPRPVPLPDDVMKMMHEVRRLAGL